jgi:hypothetical protein
MTMPKYIDAYGQPTAADNPNRMMWYSARCTFWCDDWSLLKSTGPGIPCCPQCGCPGMQTEYAKWERSAKRYDEQAAEGYLTFLQEVKNKCLGKLLMQRAFHEWLRNNRQSLDQAVSKFVQEQSNDSGTN